MKTFIQLGLVLAAALTSLHGKTVDLPNDHISIDLPDGWTQAAKPELLLFAGDAANTSALAIRAFDNGQDAVIDTAFIHDLKEGMVEQGKRIGSTVAITSEGALTMGGAPAYLVQSNMVPPGSKPVAVRSYVIDANDHFYIVSLQTTDSAQDGQLQAIASSFRFTSPPKLPPDPADALGFKMGFVIGVLLAVVAIWLIIKRLFFRGSSKP